MTRMKKVFVTSLMVALTVVMAVPASAGSFVVDAKVRSWDDLSWWGNSGATPDPVKDSTRSGYWWWPTEPASNANDEELWGNRGVVYSMWEPPAPPAPDPAPAPPTAPPAKPTRSIPVLNNVLFDFDKSVLKAEGKMEVDKVVAMLKEYPGDTVVIEGHTCNVGAEDYNMGLGQRRADAVAKYIADSGVAANRVSTVSYGETQPAVSNDTPASRKLNRRAVFKYSIND